MAYSNFLVFLICSFLGIFFPTRPAEKWILASRRLFLGLLNLYMPVLTHKAFFLAYWLV